MHISRRFMLEGVWGTRETGGPAKQLGKCMGFEGVCIPGIP